MKGISYLASNHTGVLHGRAVLPATHMDDHMTQHYLHRA